MDELVDNLNPAQRAAVTHTGGPCLVLAGAGSGKTRVISHRIAWLLSDRGVPAHQVCALTFTNKAAAEMRERVNALLGAAPAGLWLLTFHALGLRILRQAAGSPGAPRPGFSIADRGESLSTWRRAQAALGTSSDDDSPAQLLEMCSRAVNRLEDPAAWIDAGRSREQTTAGTIWTEYRRALRARNVVDFDDLLVLPLRLLESPGGIPSLPPFRHLLIDEYQDTNRLQYRLLRALLRTESSLMVVGDEDQAIYRWRGADIANVLQFQADFPGATVVRLEQNYRSTQPILAAAAALVAVNQERLGKQLWTATDGGERPRFCLCASERDEAVWVAKQLAAMLAGGAAPRDLAVLYRTNAQSRPFEEELAGRKIPFRVIGGPTFFRRAEVKALLAYLQLAVSDDVGALARAAAAPKRGIGPSTIEALAASPEGAVAGLVAATGAADPAAALRALGVTGRAVAGLQALGDLVASLRARLERDSVATMIDKVLHHSGYADFLRGRPDGEDRLANLEELAASASEFGADTPASAEVLQAFLDRAALVSDADTAKGTGGGVGLLTIHAAKGLEFDTVFVTGLEEGLFPHASAVASGQVEEERRLAYVAMTRARTHLSLSGARVRRVRGIERVQRESRFIREIDSRLLDREEAPGLVQAREHGRRDAGTGTRRAPKRGPAINRRPVSPNAVGNGQPAAVSRLTAGVGVFHPMFGPGRITGTQGSGDKLKLTVSFPRAGTKELLARYARLELLAAGK